VSVSRRRFFGMIAGLLGALALDGPARMLRENPPKVFVYIFEVTCPAMTYTLECKLEYDERSSAWENSA